VVATLVGLVALCTVAYSYERYYRGPSETVLYGTWEDPTHAMDSDVMFYYDLRSDHTLALLAGEPNQPATTMGQGRWYAGGQFIFLSLPADLTGVERPLIFHIVDIGSTEIQVRRWRDGRILRLRKVTVERAPSI
jgi:hypothetical protein